VEEQKDNIFYQLITDKDFKDWILFPNSNRNYFWENWIKKHPEDIEQVLKAKEFIQRIEFKENSLSPRELDELLKKIIVRERSPGIIPITKLPWNQSLKPWVKIAAILFLCLFSALLLRFLLSQNNGKKDIKYAEWEVKENQRGEKSHFLLPDGSLVHLNYESRISYPPAFNGDKRIVELKGEAFFEIAKDPKKPFIVKVNNIETEVLGTSFNIKSWKNSPNTEISLISGKLKVKADGNAVNDLILSPGEHLSYDNRTKKLIKGSFNLETVTSWKDGILIFKNVSLEQFIDRLERWYGVDFQLYGNLSVDWRINGRYQNEKLDDVLKGLNFVYGIEYKINGKNVTLKLK
jgi:ferric-dicitrate binding protein FerR (iron transport regulator)